MDESSCIQTDVQALSDTEAIEQQLATAKMYMAKMQHLVDKYTKVLETPVAKTTKKPESELQSESEIVSITGRGLVMVAPEKGDSSFNALEYTIAYKQGGIDKQFEAQSKSKVNDIPSTTTVYETDSEDSDSSSECDSQTDHIEESSTGNRRYFLSPTITLGGKPGKPVKTYIKVVGSSYDPPISNFLQPANPRMPCAPHDLGLKKNYSMAKKINEKSAGKGKKVKDGSDKKKLGRGPAKPQEDISESEEVVSPLKGGDYCLSGIEKFYCPKVRWHQHYVPHKTSCQFPQSCPADCLDHSDLRDWASLVPKYQFYMEKQPHYYGEEDGILNTKD